MKNFFKVIASVVATGTLGLLIVAGNGGCDYNPNGVLTPPLPNNQTPSIPITPVGGTTKTSSVFTVIKSSNTDNITVTANIPLDGTTIHNNYNDNSPTFILTKGDCDKIVKNSSLPVNLMSLNTDSLGHTSFSFMPQIPFIANNKYCLTLTSKIKPLDTDNSELITQDQYFVIKID